MGEGLSTVNQGKGHADPLKLSVEITKHPQADLAAYKLIGATDLSRKSSDWDLCELQRQVSQKLDIATKNLLGALDNSISIMISLSSGCTGPSATMSDDDFEDKDKDKRKRMNIVGRIKEDEENQEVVTTRLAGFKVSKNV